MSIRLNFRDHCFAAAEYRTIGVWRASRRTGTDRGRPELFTQAGHDHGHGHGHGTGVRWLDLVVGVSAFFISIVSLVVSIEHGRTMEKMVEQNEKLVAASTMPFLAVSGSQLDPVTQKPFLRIELKNGGVGPAVVDWFEIRYKGAPMGSSAELLKACCFAALPRDGHTKGVIYSNVSQSIMPARDSVFLLQLDPESAGKDLYVALDAARKDLAMKACYCSVLDECWLSDFDGRPKKVQECKAPAGTKSW